MLATNCGCSLRYLWERKSGNTIQDGFIDFPCRWRSRRVRVTERGAMWSNAPCAQEFAYSRKWEKWKNWHFANYLEYYVITYYREWKDASRAWNAKTKGNQINSQTYEFHCSSLFSVSYTHLLLQQQIAQFPASLPPLFDLKSRPVNFPICRIISTLLPFSKLKRLFLVAKPWTPSLDIEKKRSVFTTPMQNMAHTLITSTPTSNPRQIRHSIISNPAGTTYSPLPAEQNLRTTSANSMGIGNGESIHHSKESYKYNIYGSSISVGHCVEAGR